MSSHSVHVVGAIVYRDGAVFAARRNPERSAGGLWEFPGGKVEADESPEQALAREIREELSVEINVGQEIDSSVSTVGDSQIELTCFGVTFNGPEPTSSTDHDALAWIDVSQLGEYEWAPGDIPIIKRLPDRLRSHLSEAEVGP